jgi:hypothetical protein
MASQLPRTDSLTPTLFDEQKQREEYGKEYRRTLKSMRGPRDDGFTATFILTRADFDEMPAEAIELRRRIRARRAVQAAELDALMRAQ